MIIKRLFTSTLFTLILFSCVVEQEKDNTNPINIHAFSDAATLNPVAARDEQSHIVCKQLYQTLTAIDFETEELVGIIAKNRPKLLVDSANQLIISYEIRPEAKFDDGSQITAQDVAFSLKLNVCPLINNVGGANYYGFIKKIQFDSNNPLTISFLCEKIGPIYEYYSGDFAILQQKFYDNKDILSQFSYEDLLLNDSLENNPELIEFANEFNSDKYAFDPQFISGSGAYSLVTWNKNQNILLEKKENWWGNNISQKNTFFTLNAAKINYEVINDPTTALVALKSGKIDFMRKIPSREFQELEANNNITIKLESIIGFGYQYIGMNLNNEILADLNVRKAIAHLVPKKNILDKVFYGQGQSTNSPLASTRTSLYNDTLNPYQFDPEISKTILKSSNWKDEDKDGILEKEIDGKIRECRLTYHYNSGNSERKAVGLILKSEFKKVGIELEVIGLEWATYLEKLRSNEMNIFYNATSSLPVPPDFTSTFHSSSANGGRNYANYKSNDSDSLIELIRVTMDQSKRTRLIKEFQEVVNNELPYIFLFTPNQRLAYNQDLKNVKIYSLRPNFWPPELSWK